MKYRRILRSCRLHPLVNYLETGRLTITSLGKIYVLDF
jgi:hypothetical protein